jgi:hypothetical protein
MSEMLIPEIETGTGFEKPILPESVEINELYWHVRDFGQTIEENSFDWRGAGAILILVETQGAKYLVEPQAGSPALVTSVNEKSVQADVKTAKIAVPFMRCEAWPDETVQIDQELIFADINRYTRKLEQGSRFRTSPVKTVKFLR